MSSLGYGSISNIGGCPARNCRKARLALSLSPLLLVGVSALAMSSAGPAKDMERERGKNPASVCWGTIAGFAVAEASYDAIALSCSGVAVALQFRLCWECPGWAFRSCAVAFLPLLGWQELV